MSNHTLQDRIKQRRIALGLTLAQVADKLNVKEATVQRYESGEIKNIKHETIVALSVILCCTPQYLMGWSDKLHDDDSDSNVRIPAQNVVLRPLFNSAAAGFGVIADDTIVGYIPTRIPSPSEEDLYLWVTVSGDSMAPTIEDGSEVLVRKQTSVDSGQIAIMLIDEEEAVVKKVVYGSDFIELRSINPYYPPRRFEGADVQRLRVLGLVKKVSKNL